MEVNKDQIVEKDDETVAPTQEGTQKTSASKERPNINVITARNEGGSKTRQKIIIQDAGNSSTIGSGYYNCNIFFYINRTFNS